MQRNLWYRLEDICDWSGLKLLICDGVRSGVFFVTGGSTLAVVGMAQLVVVLQGCLATHMPTAIISNNEMQWVT